MSNIYAMVDTWNAGGTTFTAIQMNVTDTASATASLLMDLQVAAASKFKVGKDGSITLNAFASLFGDAANVLALRNSTTGQTFNVYNTTDGTNTEFVSLSWNLNTGFFGANFAVLGTSKAGTGTNRSIALASGNSGGFVLLTAGGQIQFGQVGVQTYWTMPVAGHLLAGTDNAFDIGASGATRPRQLFIAPSTTGHANINLDATGVAPTSPVNGDMWFDGAALKIRIAGATKTFTVT